MPKRRRKPRKAEDAAQPAFLVLQNTTDLTEGGPKKGAVAKRLRQAGATVAPGRKGHAGSRVTAPPAWTKQKGDD
jgi:hypothetical protein